MKKKLLRYITILFIGVTFISTAQKKDVHTYEKIKTLKINFISTKLSLSPEAAEKFWPIYNEYEKENRKFRSSKVQSIKKEISKNGSIEELTDEKAMELSNRFIELTDKYAENKRNCFKQLAPVLTPQQLLQLHFAEINFNKKVLRKLNREKKSDKQ
jgi:Spy/CpxP family protein refolding chaperone